MGKQREIVDGVNTKVEVSSEMFSDELKELITKKENLFEDLAKKNPPVKEGKSQSIKKRTVVSS